MSNDKSIIDENTIFAKMAWRIMPFLCLCFVICWLDRVNISFAHLQFKSDLNINDASFGLIVGALSLGCLIFDIPGTLILEKYGAKKTITRIMILWGIATIGTAFAKTTEQFYIFRFLLGAAEAGFFPGVILYLTYWFPTSWRARISSRFIIAIGICGIIGGPLASWIMTHLNDVAGFRGWQWLFIFTGILPLFVGVVAWFWLDDKPIHAKWLSEHEKNIVMQALEKDKQQEKENKKDNLVKALKDFRVWVIIISYVLTIICTGNVVNFWAPSIIKESGSISLGSVGLLSSLPWIIGVIVMLVASRLSDQYQERRWFFAGGGIAIILALITLPFVLNNSLYTVLTLIVMTSGYLVATAIYWTIPSQYFSESAKAGCIALVSLFGQLGQILVPTFIGYLKTNSGSIASALHFVAVFITVGLVLMLAGIPHKVLVKK
ncbi:MAG: MFS transporter [Acinetobacter sp.]